MTTRFQISPRGDFSLAASIEFLMSFTPAGYGDNGGSGRFEPVLRLAFPVDGAPESIGIAVRQEPSGPVVADVTDDRRLTAPRDQERIRDQVARILSLDVDGTGLQDAVASDPYASALVQGRRGLRPVCFNSPYEAASWAVLSQRVRMSQAAAVKNRIARSLGTTHQVDGVQMTAFPSPETLLRAPDLPGVAATKRERLHAVARAACDGRLDSTRLRSMPVDAALEDLCTIAGIGPFSAGLILVRGAGHPDVFPLYERRLHTEMSRVYGVDGRDTAALREIAHRWRPFRSWVCFLFRNQAAHRVIPGDRSPGTSAA